MTVEQLSQYFDPVFLASALIVVALVRQESADVRIVGAAFWRRILNEAELDYIVVAKEYRNQKIGENLLRSAHQFLCFEKVERATLEVSTANIAAQIIYENMGYKVVGHRKRYYSSGEDAQVYAKVF